MDILFVTSGSTVEGQASYHGFGRMDGSGELGERGFAGGFEIDSLGLVVLGPRVLDSDTGRFLSQDPVFNAVNLYAYSQGNPVFYWDPDGAQLSAAQASAAYTAAGFAGMVGGGALFAKAGPLGMSLGAYYGRFVLVGLTGAVVQFFSPGSPKPDMVGVLTGFVVPVQSGGSAGSDFGSYSPGAFGPGAMPESSRPFPPRTEPCGDDACPAASGGAVDFMNGGGLGGLQSLTFSIALSFGSAMW